MQKYIDLLYRYKLWLTVLSARWKCAVCEVFVFVSKVENVPDTFYICSYKQVPAYIVQMQYSECIRLFATFSFVVQEMTDEKA